MYTFSIEQLLQTVPIGQIRQIEDNTVYTILEKFNMCGSIKVKPVYWMLKKALERGKLSEGQEILLYGRHFWIPRCPYCSSRHWKLQKETHEILWGKIN